MLRRWNDRNKDLKQRKKFFCNFVKYFIQVGDVKQSCSFICSFLHWERQISFHVSTLDLSMNLILLFYLKYKIYIPYFITESRSRCYLRSIQVFIFKYNILKSCKCILARIYRKPFQGFHLNTGFSFSGICPWCCILLLLLCCPSLRRKLHKYVSLSLSLNKERKYLRVEQRLLSSLRSR